MMYKRKLTLWLNDWIISLVTFEVSSKQLSQHSLIMECEECDDLWKKQSIFGSGLHLAGKHISYRYLSQPLYLSRSVNRVSDSGVQLIIVT